MKPLMLALVSLLLVSAMARGTKTGKLVGHVDIGPISPVQRVGQKEKVPPEWYKRYSVVVTQRGPHNGQMQSHLIRMVAESKLSGTGDFSFTLPPGEYQVGVKATQPMMHAPEQKTVIVVSGKTVNAALSVDTGIR